MKVNVINWILAQLESGKLDENQVVAVYDKNNNIKYLGKAGFAPLSLWDEFKTAVIVGNELRINERQCKNTEEMYRKPLMMKIVGLNVDTVFYLIKVGHVWKQYTKTVGEFIHMMYVLFPDVMNQADKYQFDDKYQLANWLYNYGESVTPCETYIFYNK